MTGIQKFFTAILPKKWAEDMRNESERWILTCTSCGSARSVWEAGGIRWKAAIKGKSTRGFCQKCGTYKTVTIEKLP